MAYNKPTFNKNKILNDYEVSQEFDLSDVFDVEFDLPGDLVSNIAQDIIDRIVERTEDGKAIHGRNLRRPYSKAYKESDEFKDFGKTNKVNMTLTGRMLDDIDIIEENGNSFKVGFTELIQNKKAYNHNTGDTTTKRPFFGVSKKESDLRLAKTPMIMI